jgi:sulfonate transport system substrate-binding protein
MHQRGPIGAALCAFMVGLLAACGSGTGGSDTPDTTATTASPSTSAVPAEPAASTTVAATAAASLPSTTVGAATMASPPPVPAGTKLRIADQYGLFSGVMSLAGLDADVPYELEYVTLSPGPLQLQAFQAGEVDLGVVSPLGLIQAASGGIELHAVARWRTDFALYGVVTAPGVAGISDWEGLRGKRVAFQRNTMAEALLLLNLDRVGMSLDDITVVDVPHHEVGVTLEGGHADAGVSSEPFISAYLGANPTAVEAFGIEEPMAQSTILVATDDALADPALSAAVAEYLTRLDRAFTELTGDRDTFAALAVEIWHLDRSEVDRVLADAHGVAMAGVPGDLVDPYQRLVELLAAEGLIEDDLDAAAMFDGRFDPLLAQ